MVLPNPKPRVLRRASRQESTRFRVAQGKAVRGWRRMHGRQLTSPDGSEERASSRMGIAHPCSPSRDLSLLICGSLPARLNEHFVTTRPLPRLCLPRCRRVVPVFSMLWTSRSYRGVEGNNSLRLDCCCLDLFQTARKIKVLLPRQIRSSFSKVYHPFFKYLLLQ